MQGRAIDLNLLPDSSQVSGIFFLKLKGTNKPSSSILKIISRALQSPGKTCGPVTPPSSLTSSPSYRYKVLQNKTISENLSEEKPSVETQKKIETYETPERVVRKLELDSEVVVGEDKVSSEPCFQILSKNQE
jgi:hypothetical protein